MKTLFALLMLASPLSEAIAATPAASCTVTVTQDPVIIRMDKDEFRIAFGVSGERCQESGCAGVIRYKAAWRTENGEQSVESKLLSYDIPNGASQSIAVDRHYFDTSEGKHTTNLVQVTVDDVTCARSRLTARR
jgi:hypothetical protein